MGLALEISQDQDSSVKNSRLATVTEPGLSVRYSVWQGNRVGGFKITYTDHYYQQWSHTHYSTPHTLWGCTVELASALTAAIILADAALTLPSPK